MSEHDGLGHLPTPAVWMTRESWRRLWRGGNSKGAVPVHSKRSAASEIGFYLEEDMIFQRERCDVLLSALHDILRTDDREPDESLALAKKVARSALANRE